jgi:hypothetical protein
MTKMEMNEVTMGLYISECRCGWVSQDGSFATVYNAWRGHSKACEECR